MSLVRTYGVISTKVRLDTDTENETFITFDELVGYCQEAVDEAEAEIHNIYEDYFLTRAFISLLNGTDTYPLPSNIYANKIRALVYREGSTIYVVKRVRDLNKFLKLADIDEFGSSLDYQYIIQNDSATAGVDLILKPASRITSATVLTIWFLRNANRVPLSSEGTEALSNAALVDIPEFAQFIIEWMKMRVYEKENNPMAETARASMEAQRTQMVTTLTNMVPDNDDIIDHDYSFYEEFYANGLLEPLT